jgi:hypothetical protein
VIEQGHADFERIEHAHAVHFGQDVSDHVGFCVDVENLADRFLGWAMSEVATQNVAGILAAAEDVAEAVG